MHAVGLMSFCSLCAFEAQVQVSRRDLLVRRVGTQCNTNATDLTVVFYSTLRTQQWHLRKVSSRESHGCESKWHRHHCAGSTEIKQKIFREVRSWYVLKLTEVNSVLMLGVV